MERDLDMIEFGPDDDFTDTYREGDPLPAEDRQIAACRRDGEFLSDYLARLAAEHGWGSREVQDAYDYENGTTPDE